MSYSDGEALVLAQVQAVSNYTSTLGNTSRGKWGILNSGKSSRYAILKPGPFNRTPHTPTQFYNEWTTVVELWQRYKDDGTTLADLEADMAAILARFDVYPHMQDTTGLVVNNVVARRGNEVEEMWSNKGDGPSWLRWKLYVTWQEENSASPSE